MNKYIKLLYNLDCTDSIGNIYHKVYAKSITAEKGLFLIALQLCPQIAQKRIERRHNKPYLEYLLRTNCNIFARKIGTKRIAKCEVYKTRLIPKTNMFCAEQTI